MMENENPSSDHQRNSELTTYDTGLLQYNTSIETDLAMSLR